MKTAIILAAALLCATASNAQQHSQKPKPTRCMGDICSKYTVEQIANGQAWNDFIVNNCPGMISFEGDTIVCRIPARAPAYSCLNMGGMSMCDPDNNGNPAMVFRYPWFNKWAD